MFCEDYDSFISLLRRRNYTVHTAKDGAQAHDILFSLIPDGSTAGFGGSMTAKELCLAEALRHKGCTTYFHWEAPAAQRGDVTRKAAQADWFIASANGITRTGKIVNIDGTGNRVASMLFGPKKVALIIGKNKFAETMDECMDRIKAVACPKNAQRLGLSTPCAVAGRCVDCFSKERICSVTTIIEAKPGAISEMHLILVDEALGY